MHSLVGSHIFLLSLFLCHFDEPVKLFPSAFIKMVLIPFNFYLISTPGFLYLFFFWRITADMLYANMLMPNNSPKKNLLSALKNNFLIFPGGLELILLWQIIGLHA